MTDVIRLMRERPWGLAGAVLFTGILILLVGSVRQDAFPFVAMIPPVAALVLVAPLTGHRITPLTVTGLWLSSSALYGLLWLLTEAADSADSRVLLVARVLLGAFLVAGVGLLAVVWLKRSGVRIRDALAAGRRRAPEFVGLSLLVSIFGLAGPTDMVAVAAVKSAGLIGWAAAALITFTATAPREATQPR